MHTNEQTRTISGGERVKVEKESKRERESTQNNSNRNKKLNSNKLNKNHWTNNEYDIHRCMYMKVWLKLKVPTERIEKVVKRNGVTNRTESKWGSGAVFCDMWEL